MYFNPSIPIYTIMRLARFKGDLYFPIFKHESSRTTALIQKELPPSMSASKTPGPNLEINNSRKYTNRCYFDVLQYSQGLVYRSTASVDHEDGEGGLFLAKARIQLRRSRSSAYTPPRPFLAVIVLRLDELAERAALIQRPKSIGRILTSVQLHSLSQPSEKKSADYHRRGGCVFQARKLRLSKERLLRTVDSE